MYSNNKNASGKDCIYSHLQFGLLHFIVGDKVNQGDILGLKGSSNYYDKPWEFWCFLST